MALFGIALAIAGARRGRADLVRGAYSAVYTTCALLVIANVAMVYALVTHDFSISYVAQVGSRATPVFFTVISLWGALEGSILFWGAIMGIYLFAFAWVHRGEHGHRRVLAVHDGGHLRVGAPRRGLAA